MKKALVLALALAVIFGLGFNMMAGGHWEDGEYTGYSEAGPRGYVQANVTIEDHAITAVELIEFTQVDRAKDEDYGWDEFHEAMEVLPERFVEANDYDVDIVTGATGTSEKAMEAVRMALQKAEGVETFDGTFMGSSEPSERNAWGVAWVTFEDGKITEVSLEESAEGEFKDEDYGWEEFHEAQETMPEWFVEANDYEVDIYTGATGSSEMWMEAVRDAMAKAGLVEVEVENNDY